MTTVSPASRGFIKSGIYTENNISSSHGGKVKKQVISNVPKGRTPDKDGYNADGWCRQ